VAMEVECAIYCYSYGVWGNWFGEDYLFGNTNEGKTLVAPVVYAGLGTAADYAVLEMSQERSRWCTVTTLSLIGQM